MNAWERFNEPRTDWGLWSLLLFFGALGAVVLATAESLGGGWRIRGAWLMAGAITVYQWWSIHDYLKRTNNGREDSEAV